MKLVKQEEFGQCGAACLAMVLGDPLEDVIAEIEDRTWISLSVGGMTDCEIVEHLHKHLVNARIILDWDGQKPAILTVPSLNHRGLLHYIVWDGERYLDPAMGELRYPEDAPVINGKKTVCWATAIVWDGGTE